MKRKSLAEQMERSSFTSQEKVLLKTAFVNRRPLSLLELANESNMSWTTAKKYVKNLVKRKWLVMEKTGSRKRFEFNYDRLGGI